MGKRLASRIGFVWFPALLAIIASCSTDDNPTAPPDSDVTAPAAVTDLVAAYPTVSSLVLQWTAPGDDGSTGAASQYDVRYSTSLITEADWAAATQVSGEPNPKAVGVQERLGVTQLSAGVVYYFALKTADENENWSSLSNVASDTTLQAPDAAPPAAIADLAAIKPTAHSITLKWTSPGDDGDIGTAARYSIRFSLAPITEQDWASANIVNWPPTPKPAGAADSFEVTGLEAGVRYYFAIKTADERVNWSPISNVADGTTLTVTFSWSPIGGGMHATGLPAGVFAQIVYGGRLIAAGWFDRAGDVPANMVAAWDGSSWSDLGTGRGNSMGVVALAVHQSRLIAGGGSSSYSESPVCAWDGSSWISLGPNSNSVYALATYGDLLVAGGFISYGVPVNSVIAWNGSSWSALGPALSPRSIPSYSRLDALYLYGSQLMAGGNFTKAGEVLANGIAQWNGSSWSSLGSGVNGGTAPTVMAFGEHGGKLIVGGAFTSAGGVACSNIAAWDGNSWAPLGPGVSGGSPTKVTAIAVYNNKLIIGGAFTEAGGIPCSNIAMWDGSSWSPLGSGMDGLVYSLVVYNGQLIVGGTFATAGGYPAAYIASWSE